ncbi:colicin D domain-containing protein [Photorhabdus heterorhabditis]|uniref:colicin D domain-containing protein n=1 Tax=Photorhabdus heterorhabditis TaxID=880156 RepID=UPI000AB4EF31|nr:colicin D domain-containing protein [Photorhabdus heterorhabditis]
MDNNHLSVEKNQSRSEELVNCQGDSSCRSAVRDKYRQEYDKVQERITTCSGADQCVAVAKELRALQGDYSARISEIQEKARMQGLDSLTPAEVREWADLRGAMSNIDASRNLVLHRAQVTGSSEETTQEIVKIMGQTGIAASAGVAGGISKTGAKATHSDQGQKSNTDKGAQAETSHNQSRNAGTKGNELTSITQKQLDKKFKHAVDFGVITTKKNPETLRQYEKAIKSHMEDTTTVRQGTYGFVKDSKVFFNSNTNNAVVLDSSGNFVTGFKLTPGTPQYDNYIKNGVLR